MLRKNRIVKAEKVAAKALSAFDKARNGLVKANAHLADEKDEIDRLTAYLREEWDKAHAAHTQNSKVLAKIESLIS